MQHWGYIMGTSRTTIKNFLSFVLNVRREFIANKQLNSGRYSILDVLFFYSENIV